MTGRAAVGQRIVIVGTGGMGREAAAWLDAAGRGSTVVGFLDENDELHGRTVAGLPVLGGVEWLSAHDDVEVVTAIGTPAHRATLMSRLAAEGRRLVTVVHPSAVVGPRVTLGEGAIVCPGVILTCDITVGRGAIVNYGALVGHDGVLGEACFLAPGVSLGGNVFVGEQAYVGIGASVIQGITIGRRAVIGAGAAVIRDVPADRTVVGVPARPVG
jgi:sugar O-acyltransferase (sialic acid O-acetyltransferase NeuD family)